MARVPWVRWFPSDFLNGIVGLHAFEIAVYTVILNLIYDNNGPIRDDVNRIARRVGIRSDHCDGVISNSRADRELTERTSKVLKLVSNFGRDKSDKNKKHNKINGSEHPIGNEKTTLLSDRSTTDAHPESDLKKGPKKNAAKPRPPGIAPQARRIDPNLKPSNANIVFAQARGLRAK